MWGANLVKIAQTTSDIFNPNVKLKNRPNGRLNTDFEALFCKSLIISFICCMFAGVLY